jgi:hypothetical protein
MVVNWQNAALGLAGIIGISVAVVHGLLVQRLIVGPIERLPDRTLTRPAQKLLGPLLQFSTFNWFVGGLVLIAVAASSDPGARLATGLLVGSSYLFGAVGNLWATRGRHPGWVLYAVALALIVFGVRGG